MGLGNILFGRKKLKPAASERLFALSTARVTLDTELGLKSGGAAAVVFKPLSSGTFERVGADVEQLLEASAKDTGSKIERKSDSFGFEWVVIRDPDLEDQVTSAHAIGSEFIAQGFGPQLLAAVFRFDGGEHPVYWIYGYKRGTFWPFIPTGDGQNRDNAGELELKAKLEHELPIEEDLSRWLALFDAPI